MPPLLADFIHPGVCKPICEKSLTLPVDQSPQFTFNFERVDTISNQHKEAPFLLIYTGKKGVFSNSTIQVKKSKACHNSHLRV